MDMKYIELITDGPFETKQEQKRAQYAKALLPMKRLGNQILVMVLLMVSLLNSATSILMADIEGSLSGFLISTCLIVIFAEIMPQAIMNSDPFFFSYYSRYIMYLCFAVTYVVAAPLGIIIDRILGEEEGNLLSRSRMKKLFEKYEQQNVLRPSERKILSAALEMKHKTVGKVMTSLKDTFMLDINQNLDQNLKKTIYQAGYSRIPVYEGSRENIVGILVSRDLILTNIDNTLFTIRQLSSILVRDVLAIDYETKLELLLSFFKRGGSPMAIVTRVH